RGAVRPRDVTRQELTRARLGANVLYHEVECPATVALTLVSRIDHESPQGVLLLLWFRMKHHEPDRRLVGVDCAKPCARLEVRLRDRDRVCRHVPALLASDVERADCSNRVRCYLAEADRGHTANLAATTPVARLARESVGGIPEQ